MPLAREQMLTVLKGIEDHARAGNFDQAGIQARHLLERIESEQPEEYRSVLPKIRELLDDAARHNSRAVIHTVQEAELALGFRPE